MQVSQNSLSPPQAGVGFLGKPETPKGAPEGKTFQKVIERATTKVDKEVTEEDLDGDRVTEAEEENPLRSLRQKELKGRESSGKSNPGKNSTVQKFMASLESELGISAERFSAALMQLPVEVKTLPLVESAPFIVAELGVPEVQRPAVLETYRELMHTAGLGEPTGYDRRESKGSSRATPLPPELVETAAKPNEGSIDLTLLPKNSRRQQLNASIDEMNRKFFNVQVEPLGAPEFLDPKLVPLETPSPASIIPQSKMDPSLTPLLVPESGSTFIEGMAKPVETQSINSLLALEQNSWALPSTDPIRVQARSLSLNGVTNKLASPNGRWSVEELPFLTAPQGTETFNAVVPGFGAFDDKQGTWDDSSNGNESLGAFVESKKSKESKEQKEPLDHESAPSFQVSDSSMIKEDGRAISANRDTSTKLGVTNQERAENLNKISRATENLADRGGGEVKVILSPEGLGSVQLKVKMVDGRLQVEMKAENQESQRILESSLHELKQSLSTHRLTVDSVKVDVGGDFARQDSSASFAQPQFDQNRDQARQFMNQFRENNLFQRQAFFEPPGFKTYRSRNEEPLSGISTEIRPRESLNEGKGREINLVA